MGVVTTHGYVRSTSDWNGRKSPLGAVELLLFVDTVEGLCWVGVKGKGLEHKESEGGVEGVEEVLCPIRDVGSNGDRTVGGE